MLKRIKSIHPGWFIAGFFVILVGFNVVFFTIAASTPVDLIPPRTQKQSAVLEAPEHVAGDAFEAEVTTPSGGRAER